MQKKFANPSRKPESTGVDTEVTLLPAPIHVEGERPAFKVGRSSGWGWVLPLSIWGVCGSAWALRGLGLQGLSEAVRLEGAFAGCFNSASGWAGRKGGCGGGQRKLWAPPADENLELLQTIVSSGQACSAGRGGLEAPLPPALTSGGLASPQLGGAAVVWAQPRDWPLGVGPALSPGLWSGRCSRLWPNLGPQLVSILGLSRKLGVWL